MKTFKIITVTIIYLCILEYSRANLSVYNAAQINYQLRISVDQKLKDITFSLANFGQVPYGKSLISAIKLAPQMSDECQFDHLDENDIVHDQNFEDKFMLVQRGNCNFVYKAINAQKLGAKGVIVMDNQTEPFRIVMADNGYGYKVKIPAIFIKHQEGQLLKSLIQNVQQQKKLIPVQENGDTKMKYLDVKVNLDFASKKTEKVDLTLFLEGNNRYSYRFIRNFEKYYKQVKEQVNLKITYKVQPCPMIKTQGQQDQMCMLDCFSSGKYCIFNTIHQQSAGGKSILAQQILQYIVFQDYPDKWFAFMNSMDLQCQKISQLQQCSKKVMKEVGLNSEEERKKLQDSFQNNNSELQNSILAIFEKQLQGSGVTRFPSASVNGFLVKGSLTAQYLMSDICNTLQRPPKGCFPYIDMAPPSFPWGIIIFIVLFCTTIFTVAFIIYRRMMRGRIKQEMQGRVNDMVSKYIEFYSERNG